MNNQNILVVTATLGDRVTLKRTIESVAEIGGSRVFHVVVAPKSKCEFLQSKYPLIKIIAEPENCSGIYPALNYGLKKHAKHFKYLTFINDDDYWLPSYSNLIKVLDNEPNIDVVYGKVNYINDKEELIGVQTSSPRYKAFGALLSKSIVLFTQQATLMRSDVFLKIGGFDESFKLIADTKFWLEAINENYNFSYSNLPCAAYTIQEGQLSSNGYIQKEEHKRLGLFQSYNSNLTPYLEMYLFRLYNLRIYFSRLIKNKRLIKMRNLFHEKE